MVFLEREFTVGNKLYTIRTSGETDIRFRLKLKITWVESTYPISLSVPLFSLDKLDVMMKFVLRDWVFVHRDLRFWNYNFCDRTPPLRDHIGLMVVYGRFDFSTWPCKYAGTWKCDYIFICLDQELWRLLTWRSGWVPRCQWRKRLFSFSIWERNHKVCKDRYELCCWKYYITSKALHGTQWLQSTGHIISRSYTHR